MPEGFAGVQVEGDDLFAVVEDDFFVVGGECQGEDLLLSGPEFVAGVCIECDDFSRCFIPEFCAVGFS